MKCPKCGYCTPLKPESLETRVKKTLSYMAINRTPIFTALGDLPFDELDDELQMMLTEGFATRTVDGFYWTEKGREYADA